MDKAKIGKFIAMCRKEKKLTQEQLAEKLNISKNAVSKWERGICLMDMSLLRPLSEILEVSVNDILSGERISPEELPEKSENNIINMSEMMDYKSMKIGVIGLAFLTLILLLYCNHHDMYANDIICMMSGYNAFYNFSKYKLTKDRETLITALLWLASLAISLFLFVSRTS